MLTPAQQKALAQIASAAVDSERSTGMPAEITTAQAVIESAYLSKAPQNNCFGIKAYKGCPGEQLLDTQEWFTDAELKHFLAGDLRREVMWESPEAARNGRRHYHVKDVFAAYPDLKSCFAYHSKLLTMGVYAPFWMQYQKDKKLDAFILGVAKHYATSPDYGALVLQVAHGKSVTQALIKARGKSKNTVNPETTA